MRRLPKERLSLRVVTLLILSVNTAGKLVNVTVDDQNGDSMTGALPTFLDVGLWTQGSTCNGCKATPDTSKAFDGTWHDATWHPGDPHERVIQVNFSGTAVYAFFITANYIPYVTTLTSLSFSLDGNEEEPFVHNPTDSTDYNYNVPAFTKTDLENTAHSLTIQTAGNNATLVLFDYLVYTIEEADQETTSTSSTTSLTTSSSSSFSFSLSSSSLTDTFTTSPMTVLPESSAFTFSSIILSTPASNSAVSLDSTALSTSPPSGHNSPTSSTSVAQTSSQHHVSWSLIIGAVIGGLATVACMVLCLLCLRRRRMGASSIVDPAQVDQVGKRLSSLSKRRCKSYHKSVGDRTETALISRPASSITHVVADSRIPSETATAATKRFSSECGSSAGATATDEARNDYCKDAERQLAYFRLREELQQNATADAGAANARSDSIPRTSSRLIQNIVEREAGERIVVGTASERRVNSHWQSRIMSLQAQVEFQQELLQSLGLDESPPQYYADEREVVASGR